MDGARPAQVAPPHFAKTAFRMGVADDEIGDGDFLARLAHRLAEHVIVGELVLDPLEAADGLERAPAQGDGRADARLRHIERHAGQHIGQKAVIHPHRAEPRPEAGKRSSAIKAGDEADVWALDRRRQPVEIIRLDRNVAVRQHDKRMLDAARQTDEIGDLAVGPVDRGVDRQLHAELRRRALDLSVARLRDDAPRDRRSRIVALVDAENDLHRPRIVLAAEAQQMLVKPCFSAIKWLQHRHAGRLRRRGGGVRTRKTPQAGQSEKSIEDRHDADEGENRRDRRRADPVPHHAKPGAVHHSFRPFMASDSFACARAEPSPRRRNRPGSIRATSGAIAPVR